MEKRKMWRVHLTYFCLIFAARVVTEAVVPPSKNASTAEFVELHPPNNIQIVFTGSTEVVVLWYAPNNIDHDVIAIDHDVIAIDHDVNNTQMYPDKHINGTSFQLTVDTGVNVGGYNSTVDGNGTYIHTPTGEPTNVSLANDTKTVMVKKPDDEIQYYVVFYGNVSDRSASMKDMMKDMKEVLVDRNQTEVRLVQLQPGSIYRVVILVKYKGGVTLLSNESFFRTKGFGPTRVCACDKHGRDPKAPDCNPSNYHWCQCKQAYTGLFCEICKPGYYRVSPSFPCHRCPCGTLRSTGSCSFVNGQVRCSVCYTGYTGNLCHKCTYGHFPSQGMCERCKCNGNHDPSSPYMCSPATGQCLDCKYNTTGYQCENCAPGYDGDPMKAKNCTLVSDLQKRSNAPAVGVIAAVCVVIILSLSALAGFIVYRKWKHFPSMKPFWTVELREGHEGVNFSELSGGEQTGFPGDSRNFDDMNFYEKQHRDSKKGKQPSYAPLREDL